VKLFVIVLVVYKDLTHPINNNNKKNDSLYLEKASISLILCIRRNK